MAVLRLSELDPEGPDTHPVIAAFHCIHRGMLRTQTVIPRFDLAYDNAFDNLIRELDGAECGYRFPESADWRTGRLRYDENRCEFRIEPEED